MHPTLPLGCICINISVISQKRVTLDFLTKRQKVNEGEAPQYYVEESHEPIIPPEEWEIVQLEMARRKALGRKYSGNSIFSARLVCTDCGEFFGSKVWNSTDKYRRTIWQCNGKYKGGGALTTPYENGTVNQFCGWGSAINIDDVQRIVLGDLVLWEAK